MQPDPTTSSLFHAGERAAQTRAGVRESVESWSHQAIRPYLPPQHREFYSMLPFVVIAARDRAGRPWATMLAGAPGFAHSPDEATLRIEGAPVAGDALHGALAPGATLGVLGLEPSTRRRNRVNGRLRAAASGLELEVGQSYGNCPQYITPRTWRPAPPERPAPAARRADRLDPRQRRFVARADTMFIATGVSGGADHPAVGMDASHRGGPPGFITVLDDRRLLIPDYSGNNLFNTIGNLMVDPRAGLLLVDFATGRMLQITGRTRIDWDSPRVSRVPGARRLIELTIDQVIELDDALPLRWDSPQAALRPLRLVEKLRDSDDVTSFVFEAGDGGPLPPFEAGQHLPLTLDIPGLPAPITRSYSLSGSPWSGRYRISVKREPHGVGSRALHDLIEPGAIVAASAPAGDFTLTPGAAPVVLLSAGIGVTPMLSMLHALVESSRPVWFVHGARDGRHHPFAATVRRLAQRRDGITVYTMYSRPRPEDRRGVDFDDEGRLDGVRVLSALPGPDAEFYLCGPEGFLATLHEQLERLGVDPRRIHTEQFGPSA